MDERIKEKLIRVCAVLFILSILLQGIANAQIVKYELPEGDLEWSTARPVNAKMCVPAALTTKDGEVRGAYRLDGKSYQDNNKRKVSLVGNTFVVNTGWKSDNGFQTVTLVCYGKVVDLNPDSSKAKRRALCSKGSETFLLESTSQMTIQEFAEKCIEHCDYAVYLDMGEYGYGYIEYENHTKHLLPIAFVTSYKQTNWLYIK